MPIIAVVHHSGYGHTDVLAREVAAGVVAGGGDARLARIDGLTADFGTIVAGLADADAIVFGSPTYMGSVSAPLKAFMDASVSVWRQQAWKDKLAAGFTNSGSLSGDKLNALITLAVFAAQHGMMWVSLGEMPGNHHGNSDAAPGNVNRLGGMLGAMAQSDDAAVDVTPPSGDRATARALGMRIAQAAARWQITA